MNRSFAAMKALLTRDAPKELRWTIERARAADHQETPIMALPSALSEYFTGRTKANVILNRTERVSGGPGVPKPR